jgi:hypothetical protein
MQKQGSSNFLACLKPLDSMWNCYTEGKYGKSIRDAPDYAKVYEAKLYNCLFRDASGMDMCQRHFDDMIRSVYRSGDDKLCDYF